MCELRLTCLANADDGDPVLGSQIARSLFHPDEELGNTGTILRVGNPADLANTTPVFTIVTTRPMRVPPDTITAAQDLAAANNGVYAGIVRGSAWRSPRIVAAYQP